jgi:aspartate aminotransferase
LQSTSNNRNFPSHVGLTEAFNKDDFPKKVSVGVGAYRDDQGKPFVLPAVSEAEKRNLETAHNHEYAGITGVPSFVKVLVL